MGVLKKLYYVVDTTQVFCDFTGYWQLSICTSLQ